MPKSFLEITNNSKSGIILKINRSDVVALKELGYDERSRPIEFMHKREMAIRTKELRETTKAEAIKITEKIGGEIVDFSVNESTEWAIVFTPMKNLKIYYLLQRYRPEFEDEILTFYSKETRNINIPIDDLYDFTRLLANALVRSAKELIQ
jgi:hypothetical protein